MPNLLLYYNTLMYLVPATFMATILEFLYSSHKKDDVYSFKEFLCNITNGALYEVFLNRIIFIFYINTFITLGRIIIGQPKLEFSYFNLFLCLLISDLTFYIYHRLHHKFEILWLLHFVHHSDKKLNLSTTYRFSVLEKFYSPIMFIPALLLGFDITTTLLSFYTMNIYQFFNHSQYLRYPSFIEHIFVTPQMHNMHHDQEIKNQNSNFGSLFSVWDRIFGTYVPYSGNCTPGIKNYESNNLLLNQLDPIINYYKSKRYSLFARPSKRSILAKDHE